MRALILVLITTFFCNSYSQDKLSKYDKAVNIVTCICMKATPEKSFKCDDITSPNITDSKTRQFFDELQHLKDEKKSDSQIVPFLSEDIFKDEKKYARIFAFANNRKGQKITAIKSEIRDALEQLEDQPGEPKSMPADTNSSTKAISKTDSVAEQHNQAISSLVQRVANLENPSFFPSYFLMLLFGMLIICLFAFIVYVGNISKKNQEQIKELKRISSIPSNSLGNLTDPTLSELKRDIRDLQNKLRDSVKTEIRPAQEYYKEKPVEIELKVPDKPKQEVFYMAAPIAENTFDVSGITTPESALYEFIVNQHNTSVAKFSFISKDSNVIKSIVDYSQSYINPVCEPQNALNQNARQIITIQPGTAEKRNDKWIVTQKAQIKYE